MRPQMLRRRRNTLSPALKRCRNSINVRRLSLRYATREEISRNRCAWDEYCWVCHRTATTLFCSTCIRSYHTACVPNGRRIINNQYFSCDLCAKLKAAKKDKSIKKGELNDLLKFTVKHLRADLEFKRLRSPFDLSNHPHLAKMILNPIDLDMVREKVDDGTYQSLVEFWSDILWVQHNYRIMRNGDARTLKMLRRFVEFARQELYDIDVCGECYRNANTAPATWRTMVCAVPHILVWARMIGDRRYWPAKAMAVKKIGRVRVYVRFFADTNPNAYVDPADCYLFSKTDPSGHTIDMQQHRELQQHLRDMKAKFKQLGYSDNSSGLFSLKRIRQQLQVILPRHNVDAAMADKCFKLHPLPMTVPAARRRLVHVGADEQLAAICTDPMYQPVVILNRLNMRPVPTSDSDSLVNDQPEDMDSTDDHCAELDDQATRVDGDESAARRADADGPLENIYVYEETGEQYRSSPKTEQRASPAIDADDHPILTESDREMVDERGEPSGEPNGEPSGEPSGECPTPMEMPEERDPRPDDGSNVAETAAAHAVELFGNGDAIVHRPPDDDVDDVGDDDDDARSEMSAITVISCHQPIASTAIIEPCADRTANVSGAVQSIQAARQMIAHRADALFDSYNRVIKDRDDLRAEVERQKQQIEQQRHENARLKGTLNTILYRQCRQSANETQQMHAELMAQHRKMTTDLESKFKMDMERAQAEHRQQLRMLLRRCEPMHQEAAGER